MRISDEQRSRAVDELRRHCSAGRLPVEEYADRVTEALAAETLADLDHALRDLPTVRIADPRARPPLLAPEDPPSLRHARLGPWAGRLALLVSVGVGAAAVVLVVTAGWAWAVVLVAGWLAGLVQGRGAFGRRS